MNIRFTVNKQQNKDGHSSCSVLQRSVMVT